MGVTGTFKRILLVEDRPGSREDVAKVLRKEPDMMIIDRTTSPREALLETNRLQPELVLVDLSLLWNSRLALIRRIRAVNKRSKLIALSRRNQPVCAAQALRSGADGYIVQRRDDPEEIVDAARDVLAGHLYVSEDVVEAPPTPRSHVSRRSAKPVK